MPGKTFTIKIAEYVNAGGEPAHSRPQYAPKDDKPYTTADKKMTTEELSLNTDSFDDAIKFMKIVDGNKKQGDGYIDAQELGKALAALEKKNPEDFKKVVGAANNVDMQKLASAVIKSGITHADIVNAPTFSVKVVNRNNESISVGGDGVSTR